MRLSELTWPKAEAYFQHNDTVLLSIGSIESHGRHLPLGTDTLIPDYLLTLMEDRLDVLIAPTIPYGACDSLSDFPGTINLGIDLLYRLLQQITDELWRHGARRFIILNGHGGNCRTIEQVGLEIHRKGGMLAELNWWLMAWDLNPAWKGGHGGGEETAAILGIRPELVDLTQSKEELRLVDLAPDMQSTGFNSVSYKGVNVVIPRKVTAITDNGWLGPDHPNTATEAWGKEMLHASADYIVDFIQAFKKIPLSK